YAMGRSPEALCAEMLRVLGEQAKSTGDAARLRLVEGRGTSTTSDEEG
ncbi:transcriptional regulator, partial [Bradyrhizobium sp. PRIMUS42]|nr:transcriptional regulator [Bradyrhizobium sp. PRIMUS42]